jgi:hypothetical protein
MNDPIEIRAFSSIEDAFAFMETNLMEANANTREEQRALADGESHYYMGMAGNVVIMGYIHSEEEWIEAERKYMDMDNPEDVAEFEYMKERTRFNRERGLVPVRAFSVMTGSEWERGDLGSAHVVGMAPATKEAFDEFIAAGCRVTGRAAQPHIYQVIEHIREERDK